MGVACGIAIGWTGAGAVACGALAGAVGSAVAYAVETKVEGKGDFSWGGLAKDAAIGALIGAFTGGAGSAIGQGVKAGVSAAVGGAGAKSAVQAGGKAAGQEARNISKGLVGRGGGKAPGAAGGGAKPHGRCSSSFASGSAVLMADGTSKAINAVRIGDLVLAGDPSTGTVGAKAVSATITSGGDKQLVTITVDTDGAAGEGSASVVATANHPFWVPELRAWVDAAGLRPGQWLQTSAGTWVQVTALTSRTETAQVYNLTVTDVHTYYVVAGNTPVLVHNCGVDPATPTGSKGNPLLTRTTNQPGTINGRDYSGHALDRMQQQGIMPSVVENATRGAAIPGKRPGTTAYYDADNNITVITDSASGRVVTADYGKIRQ